MAPFSSLRTAWIRVACCRISRGSQGGIQRGEENWGGEREQFRTSALTLKIVKEELPTEPGRVRRGVDCETDGSWVVENLIVISSLKRASSKWSMQTNIQWTSPFCTSCHFSNHYKDTSKWVVQVGWAISIAYRCGKLCTRPFALQWQTWPQKGLFHRINMMMSPLHPTNARKKWFGGAEELVCLQPYFKPVTWRDRWTYVEDEWEQQLTSEVSLPKK